MDPDLPIEDEQESSPDHPDPGVEPERDEGPEHSARTIEPESGSGGGAADAEERKSMENQGDAIEMMEETRDGDVGGTPEAGRHPVDLVEIDAPFVTASGLKVRPDLFDGEKYTTEDYEEMSRLYEETFANIAEGEVVQGTVMKIQGNSVVLDVGFKSEGAVSLDEFSDPESVSVGDKVDVYLENLEDQEGVIVFSKKKADFLKVWDTIKQCYDTDEPIEGVISRKIKGGMVVNVLGVDAFLPGSQIALRRVNDLDALIGDTYPFKIIKLNKRRRNVVVSRRVILEQQREAQRKQLMEEIEVGQTREGDVKNITDFGAFIDLGGVDGLLHITDMSWGRINHPSELVTIGDRMKVKILDIDIDRGRISLGLKQLTPYPWEGIEEKYPVGDKIRGKVVSLTNYGAFVELEKGVEGLVHVSEMSWTRHIRHPSKILAIGDIVEAVVLNVDAKGEKISLGMKQVEADPWLTLAEKYPPGTRIEGKVRNLTSFGAFVEIEEGIDGLVHVSDMSWTRRVMHPSEVVKKGERVEVLVLNIDTDSRRISLGLKQVQEDPWDELAVSYRDGTETTGHIARILDKGLVVDLGEGVEGFVPISQVSRRTSRPLDQEFETGNLLALRVIECDRDNRRIVLAALEVIPTEEPEAAEAVAEAEPAAEADPAAENVASGDASAVEEAPAEAAPADPDIEAGDPAPADAPEPKEAEKTPETE